MWPPRQMEAEIRLEGMRDNIQELTRFPLLTVCGLEANAQAVHGHDFEHHIVTHRHEADDVVVWAHKAPCCCSPHRLRQHEVAAPGHGRCQHGHHTCRVHPQSAMLLAKRGAPGLYHPPGILKVRLCVERGQMMDYAPVSSKYQCCRDRNIPHANLGKLLVASSLDQVGIVEHIASLSLERQAGNSSTPAEQLRGCWHGTCIVQQPCTATRGPRMLRCQQASKGVMQDVL